MFTRLNKFRGTTPPWPPKYFYRQIYLLEGFCSFSNTKMWAYCREFYLHLYLFFRRSGAPRDLRLLKGYYIINTTVDPLSEVFFRPRSRRKTQKLIFLASEASYRPEKHIQGNEFWRRTCLYPLLLGQILKKKQFLKKNDENYPSEKRMFFRRFFIVPSSSLVDLEQKIVRNLLVRSVYA